MKPIPHYSFGTMAIASEEIRGDLFIHPDGRIPKNWWRAEGHRLQLQDLTELLADRPAMTKGGASLLDSCQAVLTSDNAYFPNIFNLQLQ